MTGQDVPVAESPLRATVIVQFDRPSFDELRSLGRAERLRALRSRSAHLRQSLVRWIDEHGFNNAVMHISEPTSFNVLFVTCTPEFAEHLINAPHVDRVFMNDDLPVELLHQRRSHFPAASDDCL